MVCTKVLLLETFVSVVCTQKPCIYTVCAHWVEIKSYYGNKVESGRKLGTSHHENASPLRGRDHPLRLSLTQL